MTRDAFPPTIDDPRRAALLAHLARYRLTTFATLQRLRSVNSDGPRTIRQLLRASEAAGLIGSAWLHRGMRYWHLASASAEHLQLTATAAGPLSEPAKLRAYALLRFCRWSTRPRRRLTSEELGQQFPDLYRSGLPQGYYVDLAGDARVGFARIDAGHAGRWDRVLQTVRQDVSALWLHPGSRRLLRAGQLEITLLTVLPQKAQRLTAALQNVPDLHRVSVHVVALPELLPLVGSLT